MLKRLPLPAWVLVVSLTLFIGTWIVAPSETHSSDLRLAGPQLLPRQDLSSLAGRIHAAASVPVWRRPRTLFGFDHPYRVSLTFDDGPHPRYTPKLLQLLKKNGTHATFFINGYWLEPGRPGASRAREALLQADRDGHEIGNHTYAHAMLSRLPSEQQTWQILANDVLLTALLGHSITLFRPPYGQMTQHAAKVLREHGYVVAGWNAAAGDENLHDPERIATQIMRWIRYHRGGIVLLHDRYPWSVAATELILNQLNADNCKRLAENRPRFEVVPLDSFLVRQSEWRASLEEAAAEHQDHLAQLTQGCDNRPN